MATILQGSHLYSNDNIDAYIIACAHYSYIRTCILYALIVCIIGCHRYDASANVCCYLKYCLVIPPLCICVCLYNYIREMSWLELF